MSQQEVIDAVDSAEEVADPLAQVVERALIDQASAFEDASLAVLAEVRRTAPAAYERARQSLKNAGVSVARLETAMQAGTPTATSADAKQADVLLELASEADLFHSPDGAAHADIRIGGHRETWPVRSSGFRQWLAAKFYNTVGGAPRSDAVSSAVNVLEAKAKIEGEERLVFVGVAAVAGRVYLDLRDASWKAVEVDWHGWRVLDEPPVRFRRAPGMKELPAPARGGRIALLRPFLNVKTEQDFILAVSWMLATLRGAGPYPVLMLAGEQGSAKSTCASILRAVLDPNTSALRSLPRNDREMFISAVNSHILAFDNLSGLSASMSDTLCRLSTGGGFAVRQLYTDTDETLFDAMKPIILTAIEDIIVRPDLADRAVFITLEPISDAARRSEADLWAAFNEVGGLILGALLDAVADGLRELPNVKLEKVPRMADFTVWASACEGNLWPSGTFVKAYLDNLQMAVVDVIDADAVACAVREFMAVRDDWDGTATALLQLLRPLAEPELVKAWPPNGWALANRLRRAATFLRKIGIDIKFGERTGKKGTRTIFLTRQVAETASAASAASAPAPRRAKVPPQADAADAADAPIGNSAAVNRVAADGDDNADRLILEWPR